MTTSGTLIFMVVAIIGVILVGKYNKKNEQRKSQKLNHQEGDS